jgi:hypothetical protein
MIAYYKYRPSPIGATVWNWLVYVLGAFAVGISLSYCTIQALATAAKVVG